MAIVSLPLLPLSVLVVGTFNLLCCLCLDPRSNPAPIPSPAAPVTAPDGFPAAVRGAISRQRRRARFPLRRREVGRARALGCPRLLRPTVCLPTCRAAGGNGLLKGRKEGGRDRRRRAHNAQFTLFSRTVRRQQEKERERERESWAARGECIPSLLSSQRK